MTFADRQQLLYDYTLRLTKAAEQAKEALMDLENDNGSIPDPIWQRVRSAIKSLNDAGVRIDHDRCDGAIISKHGE